MRSDRVREIARIIAQARSRKTGLKIIILYGGGSFGHPLAHRYRLIDQRLSAHAFTGVGHTASAMRDLGNRLAAVFLEAGIPIMPLQTSSFVSVRRGRVHFANFSMIQTILKNGGVPLFGGDVAFKDSTHSTIISADSLAVELARMLTAVKLLFATDTDGVYAAFPPRKDERPLISLNRAELRNLLKKQRVADIGTDVTGGMLGKLRALLAARNTTATIFGGNSLGSLAAVLKGKRRGTRITL